MSAEEAASVYKRLESQDFRVLLGVELGMMSHEFVPLNTIVKYSNLLEEEVNFRLRRLHALNLLKRRSKPFIGFSLNYLGYDCLAINALVKGGYLEALGKPLGIGKESDVYDALGPQGVEVAVKFMRLGRTSFRSTRRVRTYVADRRHTSWLYQSRLAAEREFQALKALYKAGVAVPKPIAKNRHAIVMGIIRGAELADYYEIPKPRLVLREILRNLRKAFLKAGIVHSDLSEFNVIIKPDAHIFIIDWPQYVAKDNPRADEYLKKDVENILRYFRRKFNVELELDDALAYVRGTSRTLKVS
jgi:RIO kinase 2